MEYKPWVVFPVRDLAAEQPGYLLRGWSCKFSCLRLISQGNPGSWFCFARWTDRWRRGGALTWPGTRVLFIISSPSTNTSPINNLDTSERRWIVPPRLLQQVPPDFTQSRSYNQSAAGFSLRCKQVHRGVSPRSERKVTWGILFYRSRSCWFHSVYKAAAASVKHCCLSVLIN